MRRIYPLLISWIVPDGHVSARRGADMSGLEREPEYVELVVSTQDYG